MSATVTTLALGAGRELQRSQPAHLFDQAAVDGGVAERLADARGFQAIDAPTAPPGHLRSPGVLNERSLPALAPV